MTERPNILLLMTDQQRGDCLGVEAASPVQTPYLDELAATGTRFSRAYSACPVCVPARRTTAHGVRQRRVVDAPVELMDVMPTLLEAAGAAIPPTVEGRSLLSLLREGGQPEWRAYLHGECSEVPTLQSGMQYLTDGRRKYVWWPGAGREQFFDLESDPREMADLSAQPDRADEVAAWRDRLVEELADRPEGFTEGGALRRLPGPTPAVLATARKRAER